jgi:hypothetical protein
MVSTGFSVTMKILTGGTCSCSGDVISVTNGTCTTIPYIDTYDAPWTRELIPYTGFGDKIAKNLPGMPSLEISFSGGLDLTNAVQLALYNGLVCSSPTTRILKVLDGGKTFTHRGYITGSGTGSSAAGKSTFNAKLNCTHLPTLA